MIRASLLAVLVLTAQQASKLSRLQTYWERIYRPCVCTCFPGVLNNFLFVAASETSTVHDSIRSGGFVVLADNEWKCILVSSIIFGAHPGKKWRPNSGKFESSLPPLCSCFEWLPHFISSHKIQFQGKNAMCATRGPEKQYSGEVKLQQLSECFCLPCSMKISDLIWFSFLLPFPVSVGSCVGFKVDGARTANRLSRNRPTWERACGLPKYLNLSYFPNLWYTCYLIRFFI